MAKVTKPTTSYLNFSELVLMKQRFPVFVVPQTHDMVSTLLSPTQPKNLSDIAILGVLALHIALLYFLPSSIRTPILCATFLFWRTAYNFGIGVLLHNQSNRKWLVYWARKSGIFDASRQPVICKLVKQEIEAKIPDEVKSGDYVFEDAPIEYNTWLVFRRVVDLILMCDFVSYVLFAISCASLPEGEGWVLTMGRWVGGIVLFMFNLWVKLDAHRVVKDYAWCEYFNINFRFRRVNFGLRYFFQTGVISFSSLTRILHLTVYSKWHLTQCTLLAMPDTT
jgi:phosphatidylethanolamine N-methyltransferase